MRARRLPGWLLALAIGAPALLAAYVMYAVYWAPLPTKGAGEMVRDLLEGAAPFSEALSTAGRADNRAQVYIRFRSSRAAVDHLVKRFGLVPAELTPAQIGAIRQDDRMPEWWRPRQELTPGTFWTGARDGWDYRLYFDPAGGVVYFHWTML